MEKGDRILVKNSNLKGEIIGTVSAKDYSSEINTLIERRKNELSSVDDSEKQEIVDRYGDKIQSLKDERERWTRYDIKFDDGSEGGVNGLNLELL